MKNAPPSPPSRRASEPPSFLRSRKLYCALLSAVVLAGLALTGLTLAQDDNTGRFVQSFFNPPHTKEYYLTRTNDYVSDREKLLFQHGKMRFCADQVLTQAETNVARQLNTFVTQQFNEYRAKEDFAPSQPFYLVKDQIRNSDVFKLLQKMPKGGLLHVHLSAAGRADWIVTNALTLTNCYVSWTRGPPGSLKFFRTEAEAAQQGFISMSQAQVECARTNGTLATELRRWVTLGPEDYGQDRVWAKFGEIFPRLDQFVRYAPVFTNYLLDAFQTMWDDGIYYVELRDSAASLYDFTGSVPTDEDARYVHFLNALREVRTLMQKRHPAFDCRLILTDLRWTQNAEQSLKRAFLLRRDFPDMVIGYDLIGEEDPIPNSRTQDKILALLPKLSEQHEQNAKVDLPYYLHDGESAWADNDNLFDAVLLKAPRIGHGFNLFRYPSLYPVLMTNNVVLEVCPISNQLLNLMPDLRMHPASSYLNAGIQCVLASDDPAIFGNDGLSYDFWEALMSWHLDLAALKKLARNSISYSGVAKPDKNRMLAFWESRWKEFIEGYLPGASTASQPQKPQ